MNRKGASRTNGRERGATLVHMAIAMVAVMGFSALVIDYGIFWAARRQAQNSADAGALAGAIALAFDDPTNFSNTGPAVRNAKGTAEANAVWGQPPSLVLTNDDTSDVRVIDCPDGAPDKCVRVRVHRTLARGNSLPTFFGRLVGVNTQDVRASAIAQVLHGNSTNCLKPWAVADKWDEVEGEETEWQNEGGDPDWTPDSTFDKYSDGKGKNPPQEDDLYVAPTEDSPGTSYQLFNDAGEAIDYGKELRLKLGGNEDVVSSGWFLALQLQDDCPGGDCYRENIMHCANVPYAIGDTVTLSTEQGVKQGPTDQAVESADDCSTPGGDCSLVNQDPYARWYEPGETLPNGGSCEYGCVYSPDTGINASPRIVPIPVFNIDEYLQGDPEGKSEIVIRNMLGFFVVGMDGKDVLGRLVSIPGDLMTGGTVDPDANFLLTIKLVR